MEEIIGFYFDSKGKFQGYVYSDEAPEEDSAVVKADAELVSYVIQALKHTELQYKGKLNIELTIKDKDLFQAIEPEKMEGTEGMEFLELKMAMADMLEQKDKEILELKMAMAEIVEGGIE